MKHCKNCGKELDSGADYCPDCGQQVREGNIVYTKTRGGDMTALKVFAVIFGGFFILVGIPILFAGTAVTGVTRTLNTEDGYIGVRGIDLTTSTQALVFKDLDIEGEIVNDFDNSGIQYWGPDPGDFMNIRFSVDSNNGKDVFIGIAKRSDALEYFSTAEYVTVTNLELDGRYERRPYITYGHHSGDEITVSPLDMNIWETYAYGDDITLTWEPEFGDYWVIMMNEDLSSDVNVETGVGVKIPILNFVSGGLICFAIGAGIIYLGVFRRVD
ncbi:MAG: zinc ribbon domain-containing protein [Candidatus Bathyarchaeota archaeon]|nr:zinc ribbon domain-containing protein [Candidatus Bathyarchaeota archaeon]